MNSEQPMSTREDSSRSQVYFCDKQKNIPLFTRKSFSKEQRDAIRSLHQLDVRKNWRIALFFFLWGVGGVTFLSTTNIIVHAACFFWMGCCVNGLPILMHESCHSLLSKHPATNRWLGFLSGLPGLIAVSAYRSIHLVHHSTTRTAKDPDDIEVNAPKSLPLVVVYYLVLVFGIYLYMGTVAITGYKKANERMKKQILVEYALIGMLLAALFALCDVSLVLNLWIIPLLIAAQLSNARGLAEHGLTATGNEFLDTRTVVSSRFVSFFMCNLNYHLEHHLFPGVPWYHLRSIHALLKNDFARAGASVYRGYTHFLVDFFKASRIGIVADVRLLPAHIREEVCL